MRKQKGFSLIELLIVVAIILIIAAIAIPNLLRSRISANESSAVGSIRTLNTAQVTYATTYPIAGFTCTLSQLGPGATPPTSTFAGLIDNVLAAGQKSGYNFALGAGAGSAAGPMDCNGTATITAYYATGMPMTNGTTGTRSFAVNAGNTIWQLNGGAAPTEPFGAPATPIQ